MRLVAQPSVINHRDIGPVLEAHSRGGNGAGGHYTWQRARGAYWRWTVVIPPMSIANALVVRAWLHSLRGSSGSTLLQLPTRRELTATIASFIDGTRYSDSTDHTDVTAAPSLTVSGTVAAATAQSETLTVTGIATSSLLVGEFALVNSQLLRIVEVAGSVITVRPHIRAAVASGAAISVGGVTAAFRLVDQPPSVPLRLGRSEELTIEFEEVY